MRVHKRNRKGVKWNEIIYQVWLIGGRLAYAIGVFLAFELFVELNDDLGDL